MKNIDSLAAHIAKGYAICFISFIIPVYLFNLLENVAIGESFGRKLIYYTIGVSKYIFLSFYNVISGVLLIPYYNKLVSLVEDHFNLQKLSVSFGFAIKNIFFSLYTYIALYCIYLLILLTSLFTSTFISIIFLFAYWQLYYSIACLSSIYPMSNALDLLQTHPTFLILVAPLSYMTCTGSFEEALLYYQLLVIPILVIIRLIHGYMPIYRVEWLNWLKAGVLMLIKQNKKSQE